MAYVAPTTKTTGQKITESIWNQDVKDNVLFLANAPACRATGTNTTIADNTDTVVPFATESYDTDTMHDTSVNNSRVTIKTAGVYLIVGNVSFPTNGTGYRFSGIRLNGTTFLAQDSKTASTTATDVGHCPTTTYKFAVNDYVELVVKQTSGGNLALSTTGGPALSATWLAIG